MIVPFGNIITVEKLKNGEYSLTVKCKQCGRNYNTNVKYNKVNNLVCKHCKNRTHLIPLIVENKVIVEYTVLNNEEYLKLSKEYRKVKTVCTDRLFWIQSKIKNT